MNVFVNKKSEAEYSFLVREEKGDIPEMEYRSERDFFLVAGVKPFYPTYAHAHSMALKIAEQYPEIVKARRAAYASCCSNEQVNEVEEFFRYWKSLSSKNNESLKLCASSASNLSKVSKFANSSKIIVTASKDSTTTENSKDKKELLDCLRCFAEAAAVSLSPVSEKARIYSAEYIPASNSYDVVLGDESGELCCLKFDNRLLLCDVLPEGRILKETPYHSRLFFERYFEPIMTAIGNVCLSDDTVVVVNHPSSKRRKLKAFNISDSSPRNIKLDLPDSEDSAWGFSEDSVISATASLKNTQVKCTRADLPTYYGRTGDVVEEIDRGSYKDIVVDFKRGLGLVVMTESDIVPFA